MSKIRSINSLANAFIGSISQFVILIFAFLTRTAFINKLGAEYLGFDSLFTNILSVLSIVDLGISTALNYSLYKPMHEDDKLKIAAIIQYFKKAFNFLGVILLIISLLITPFIGFLIKDIGTNLAYMQKIFFLYSIMTFMSYFFVDCRTLYFSSQQNYKVLMLDFTAKILVKSFQIILLYTYPSYILYLVIEIITNLCISLIMKRRTKKDFSFVYNRKYELSPIDKKIVFKDIKYISLGKIASVGTGSTDSIIISKFVGTVALGAYSNYWLITSASVGLVNSFTNGIIASLGDLFAENNQDKIKSTFKLYNFITFQSCAFYLIATLSLIQPFMYLWLKGDLLLDKYIIGVVVFNNSFVVMWNSLKNIVQTKGLFKKDLPIQIVQVIVNLIFSVVLVQVLGMVGVFIGTTLSYVCAYLMQAYLVSDEVLKSHVLKLLGQQLLFGIIAFLQLFLIYSILDKLIIDYTIFNLFLRSICMIMMFTITECLIYWNNHEFKTCLGVLKNVLQLWLKK